MSDYNKNRCVRMFQEWPNWKKAVALTKHSTKKHGRPQAMSEEQLALGAINDFSRGWAVLPYGDGKSHYWELTSERFAHGETYSTFETGCGLLKTMLNRFKPLGSDFDQCKRCLKKHHSVGDLKQ